MDILVQYCNMLLKTYNTTIIDKRRPRVKPKRKVPYNLCAC